MSNNTLAPQEAVLTADQEIDAIMEQAQVFASAWAFLGGPFDNGSGLETAEREKANLRALLSKLRAPVAKSPEFEGIKSAPVAGEAQPAIVLKAVDEYGPQLDWTKHWVEYPIGTRFYAAPQASEAVRLDADALDLARAGMDLHSPGMPEHTVCAELVRIAAALSAQPGEQAGVTC